MVSTEHLLCVRHHSNCFTLLNSTSSPLRYYFSTTTFYRRKHGGLEKQDLETHCVQGHTVISGGAKI